jgi:hypothetical protein
VLSALLLVLAGVSFIFGANGFAFIRMFLPIVQWKRPKVQSSLPLEDFFESLTTAIPYLRYSPGIKILLAPHALLPVVGLTGTTSESFSPGISGFSRDLADLLLQDMKQAIGHFERHPVCKSLTHEEASGFHH